MTALQAHYIEFHMVDAPHLVSSTLETPTMNSAETPDKSVSNQGLVPAVERDALITKLKNVPEEVLRNILTNQVDLEIRLKHKELRLTEEEIGKCEAQMLALRKFFEVPNEVSFRDEPNDFTLKYFDILNKSLSVNYTKLQQLQYAQQNPVFKESMFMESDAAPHSYRTRSTTSSLRPSMSGPAVRIAGCLYRRTDGVIVKLTCPDCQRSNFSSAQGFLNHSRIAHSKEFASQDSAALNCGNVLPDEFQDDEGLASLASMKLRNLDPSKNVSLGNGCFDSVSVPIGRSDSTAGAGSRPASRRSTPELSKDLDARSKEAKAIMKDSINEGVGTQELMKRIISSGVARDADDFKEMIGEMQKEVTNAHLFADEEEVEEVKEETEKGAEVAQPSNVEPVKEVKKTGPAHDNKPTSTSPTPIQNEQITLSLDEAIIEDNTKRSDLSQMQDSGGRYENRLRRRKSRGDMTLMLTEEKEVEATKSPAADDRRYKRRRSQR